MIKNKKTKVGIVGLIAVMVVGGSVAYFSQTMSVDNEFNTGKYGATLVEKFTPPAEKWEPGMETNKDVMVKNTENTDLVVRVKMEEKWVRNDQTIKTNDALVTSNAIKQDVATDGLIDTDGTLVEKKLVNASDWTKSASGYFYYNNVLKAGETTSALLDAVKLGEAADMGEYETIHYYTKDAVDNIDAVTNWLVAEGNKVPEGATFNKTEVKRTSNLGYSDATYTLTITADTVQVSEAAVKATFGTDVPSAVKEGWAIKY
ncbi:MAG: BsaA family SipW-dependent biofilm matrix protein [Anaerovoracaceae bacterium]